MAANHHFVGSKRAGRRLGSVPRSVGSSSLGPWARFPITTDLVRGDSPAVQSDRPVGALCRCVNGNCNITSTALWIFLSKLASSTRSDVNALCRNSSHLSDIETARRTPVSATRAPIPSAILRTRDPQTRVIEARTDKAARRRQEPRNQNQGRGKAQ